MKELKALSIEHSNGILKILDQKQLPNHEVWEQIQNPKEMVIAIKELKVRGAPLIGVAAALSLALYAEQGASESEFMRAAEQLRESRPTAVNLMYAIDKLTQFETVFNKYEVIAKAENIFYEDVALCERIAKNGEKFIEDDDNILTHCNTGGLAAAGIGTALGIIKAAFESGKKIHVYVDETRPLLQGGRLTTWELKKYGIPYTLICDNMAAALMAQGKIQKVLVGADRIATNGDFANKTGTYSLALAAKYHHIDFYCAAPVTTLDLKCSSGKSIPIEQRANEEVRGFQVSSGGVEWTPKNCDVYNPAFDVTPAGLVTAWIFDSNVVNQGEFNNYITKNF
ncbi:MAG: S-methyl-5-thioribose-1-phosphate isomerase [Bdellovibrionales bacterium]|nr:S-methyl-5-thioribose-1-phosphate isomerase [Bdellovibrionales bacterium]